MPIKKILKILGFIFLPLIPMVITVYFLFPYLNEEKHSEVVDKYSKDFSLEDSVETLTNMSDLDDVEVNDIGESFSTLREQADTLQETVEKLKARLDSVHALNDSLKNELKESGARPEGQAENPNAGTEVMIANAGVSEEQFSENIKSLLDLDVENLTPIINKMSDEQLVRIFNAGSGLQRKQLLRALESERAAKLMSEVL